MKPKKILLATDLSCRCDRALDRAVALAVEWKAPLAVLHSIPNRAAAVDIPSHPDDTSRAAKARVYGDVQETKSLDLEVLVEWGDPAARIIEAVERLGCALVVTGVARDETLGRMLVGATTNRLARKVQVPLLVVKSRPRGPYQNILVATDHSEHSRIALEAALALWPGAHFTVFHAARATFEQFADDKIAMREMTVRLGLAETQKFLEATPAVRKSRSSIATVCECGEVGELLQSLVQTRGIDLVVIGTGGSRAIVRALLGSVAQDLLRRLPIDTLVVGRGKF